MNPRSPTHSALTAAWLVLVALTLASLAFGKWTGNAPWLPLAVAVLIWVKCAIVADRFIESNQAHSFIRGLVQVFIALAPVALVLIFLFGRGAG